MALKHMQATLYLIRSEMGSHCSFFRRGVGGGGGGGGGGGKRTSFAAKF